VACSRTGASGADEELLWLLGLADPVHLDDDHAFAADVGQVHEHQRASLDGAQPRRLACELPPVEEDHRFADGQFLGYLTDRCQGGSRRRVRAGMLRLGSALPAGEAEPSLFGRRLRCRTDRNFGELLIREK